MTDPAGGHPRDLLSDYLDDELPVEERAAVDRHLADCEDCRTQLSALVRLSRAIADEPVPPVPDGLLERTGRRLDQATIVRPRRFRFVLPTTIAATLAALGILVAVQWRQGGVGEAPWPQASAPAREKTEAGSTVRQEPETHPSPAPALSPQPPPARVFDQLSKDRMAKEKVVAVPDGVVGGAVSGVAGGVAEGVEGGVPGGALAGAEKRADAGVQDPDGDGNPNVNGARERDFKANIDERAKQDAPAPPMARMAPMAPAGAPVSACVDRWSDSGVAGSWAVANAEVGGHILEGIAREAGGSSIWWGAADGRPFVLAVPRHRFQEVFKKLGTLGVTGLGDQPALAPGDDCAGVSIALTAP